MNSIIVTVTDLAKRFFCDIEVPTDVTIDKLKDDIVETLNGYNPELYLRTLSVELFSNRLGKQLCKEDTLESVGAWNGDYITIIEV